ncbi:MAG: ParB/RepB/Spo0J family partition protein [Frankia sp.]|nr:ParB/RepB/Spo0J family partition protein [Frankia sp.]
MAVKTAAARKPAATRKSNGAKPGTVHVLDITRAHELPASDEPQLLRMPLSAIEANPDNPRRKVGDVTELAESIKAAGLLQPIVVTRKAGQAGRYRIVFGHRRFAAVKAAGFREVPCIVDSSFDGDAGAEAAIIENLQRADLNPLDEAAAFQAMLDRGYSQRKLAARIGCDQAHVSKRVSLLALPPKIAGRVSSGELAVTDAQELAKLKTPDLISKGFSLLKSSSWRRAPDVVEALRKERREIEERDAKHAELEAAGTANLVREVGARGQTRFDPPGPEPLHEFGYRNDLNLPGVDWRSSMDELVAAHAPFDCHAPYAALGGEVAYACIDPDRHAKPEVAARVDNEVQARQAKAREAQAERERAREAAAARRTEVAGEIVRRDRLSKGEAGVYLATHIVAWAVEYGDDSVPAALSLLGVDVGEDMDEPSLLRDYADKSPAQLQRAALACALADGLSEVDPIYRRATALGVGALGLLTGHGYEPTADERELLRGRAEAAS